MTKRAMETKMAKFLEADLDGARERVAAVLDPAPASGPMLHVACLASPIGALVVGTTDDALCFLEYTEPERLESMLADLRRAFALPLVEHETAVHDQLREELDRYFAGGLRGAFQTPLALQGTAFQKRAWEALLRIPYGQTLGYADVARIVGQPTAVRAVGAANGRNRIALIVPCHRLVGSGGQITGYGGAPWRKRWLLAHERGESPAVRGLTDPERSLRGTARAVVAQREPAAAG